MPDPSDPTLSILVDAQRTKGLEVGLNGNITREWSMAGGYAYQDGEITRSISATAQAGAVLAQLPKHSISLWNKYDVTPRLAAALGVIYRSDVFTSTDNLVVLPNWTRVDAAVLLQPDVDDPSPGQHRESVRRGLLPQRPQQHEHHAWFPAGGSLRADHAVLTRARASSNHFIEVAQANCPGSQRTFHVVRRTVSSAAAKRFQLSTSLPSRSVTHSGLSRRG